MELLSPSRLETDLRATYLRLVEAAVEARQHAYAPHSRSLVGAAVLGESGKIYSGANFEFTRYADHAEQVALHQAIAAGERKIEAVAVFAAPEGEVQEAHFLEPTGPCGNCRQALFDLADELTVLRPKGRGDFQTFRLTELLPHAYKRTWPQRPDPPTAGSHSDPLVEQALLARFQSLPLRTGTFEGAAVETHDGQIFRGSKIELSSYASQPERMALATASLHGQRRIRRLALVGGQDRVQLPLQGNWDSLQALHAQNPHLQVVHPDEHGNFVERDVLAYLRFLLEQRA